MATILVIDDDPHIREVVRFSMERAGHRVLEAGDGRAAIEEFARSAPDLVVLDIIIPEQDGLEVCRRIRTTSDVPILFLSSRDDELDKILGLELGADDYVTKPFSPRELVARVKAMLRRAGTSREVPAAASSVLRRGPLTMDAERHKCLWDTCEIQLTPTEFQLLHSLLVHPERVYSRAELVQRAYGHGHSITERTVDSHVRRIRRKFTEVEVDPIETVFGIGYRLNPENSSS